MGEVDGAEAHLQKLTSFPLERPQRICSRGLTCSNLQHSKNGRAECEKAKPAGAEELAARVEVAAETLIGRACPRAAAERARGGWAPHKVCWMMPTARGKHARGARVIIVTILAIAALGHYQTVAWLEATEFTYVRGN